MVAGSSSWSRSIRPSTERLFGKSRSFGDPPFHGVPGFFVSRGLVNVANRSRVFAFSSASGEKVWEWTDSSFSTIERMVADREWNPLVLRQLRRFQVGTAPRGARIWSSSIPRARAGS
jgi:outer membrane protein assembly factor BamB